MSRFASSGSLSSLCSRALTQVVRSLVKSSLPQASLLRTTLAGELDTVLEMINPLSPQDDFRTLACPE